MHPALLTLIVLVLNAQAAPQDRKKDRIVPRQGQPVEGTIVRETWKEVAIKLANGPETAYACDDVAQIEYADMPDALTAAMVDIDTGNWQEALGKISSAEDLISGKGMDQKSTKKITV